MIRAVALAAGVVAIAGAAASSADVRPNPAEAGRDGCGIDRFAIFRREEPNWAYVYDRETKATDPPPAARWVSGIALPGDDSPLGVHPTPVDDPFTHDSYDLIVNLRPDDPDAYVLGGDEAAHTGNFAGEEEGSEATGRLHMEREEVGVPFAVWPEQGDRVEAYGSWVWDCEHFAGGGARTEFHPIRALWAERRVSTRSRTGEAEASLWYSNVRTAAGVLADCAHRTKGDRQAFKTCQAKERADSSFQDTGTKTFVLRARPRPTAHSRLRARLVNAGSSRGAPRPTLALTRNGVRVTLALVAGRSVRVAYHVFVGWTPAVRPAPRHLRIQLEQLLVRRAMDPSCKTTEPDCPAKAETTQLGQVTASPGEWALYVDVGGIWAHVRPLVLRVRDGERVRLRQHFDLYVPRGRAWRIFAFTRECDFGSPTFSANDRAVYPCPHSGEFGHPTGDDKPGYFSVRGSLGRHSANSGLEGSTCPSENRNGCYRLTWRVTEVRGKG
jgi:hypothetical protein